MEIRIFDLPTNNDSIFVIEKKLCELIHKSRSGESLDEVEITWMDMANNWLMVC